VLRARRAGRPIGRKLLVGVSLNGSMLAERVRGELLRALGMAPLPGTHRSVQNHR
jgi:hypothetical protein